MPLGRMYAIKGETSLQDFGGSSACLLQWKPEGFVIGGDVPFGTRVFLSSHIWVLHEFRISQNELVGDANCEMVNIRIVRGGNGRAFAGQPITDPDVVGLPLAGPPSTPPDFTGGKHTYASGIGTADINGPRPPGTFAPDTDPNRGRYLVEEHDDLLLNSHELLYGDVLFSHDWNNQSEFVYMPLPDARIVLGSPHPNTNSNFHNGVELDDTVYEPCLQVQCTRGDAIADSADGGLTGPLITDNVKYSAVWEEIPFSLDALDDGSLI